MTLPEGRIDTLPQVTLQGASAYARYARYFVSLNSKNNVPYLRIYLGIETVSCRLLQWMARMDMN